MVRGARPIAVRVMGSSQQGPMVLHRGSDGLVGPGAWRPQCASCGFTSEDCGKRSVALAGCCANTERIEDGVGGLPQWNNTGYARVGAN
jgi:hypothetical protein